MVSTSCFAPADVMIPSTSSRFVDALGYISVSKLPLGPTNVLLLVRILRAAVVDVSNWISHSLQSYHSSGIPLA